MLGNFFLPTFYSSSEHGFKFIGCFVTSLRGKGKKFDNEWDEINYRSGAPLAFKIKTDSKEVKRADHTVETTFNKNVVATKRCRKQEVGRMLGSHFRPVSGFN
jgi:hypothetical protein